MAEFLKAPRGLYSLAINQDGHGRNHLVKKRIVQMYAGCADFLYYDVAREQARDVWDSDTDHVFTDDGEVYDSLMQYAHEKGVSV